MTKHKVKVDIITTVEVNTFSEADFQAADSLFMDMGVVAVASNSSLDLIESFDDYFYIFSSSLVVL